MNLDNLTITPNQLSIGMNHVKIQIESIVETAGTGYYELTINSDRAIFTDTNSDRLVIPDISFQTDWKFDTFNVNIEVFEGQPSPALASMKAIGVKETPQPEESSYTSSNFAHE